VHAHEHETASADISATRIDHRECISDRDSCVDRIAATAQNLDANLRGIMLFGDDHRMRRARRSGVPSGCGRGREQ
jgi:hypothetical protein